MKNLTRTILGIIALCFSLMSFSACQEDVVPITTPENTVEKTVKDKNSETDGEKDDEGVKPR